MVRNRKNIADFTVTLKISQDHVLELFLINYNINILILIFELFDANSDFQSEVKRTTFNLALNI